MPSIVGGILILPATPEIIAGVDRRSRKPAPEELSTIATVMKAPPMPFLPEEHHGKLVIFALMAYAATVRPASGRSHRSASSRSRSPTC